MSEDTGKIIEQLRAMSDPGEARAFLAARGHACIGKSMLKKAEDAGRNSANDNVIIENLKKNAGLLRETDGKLYMVFPQCYCHHLKNFDGDIPATYCYCSEAWVRHFMKTAFGRDINAEVEKSVLRGDEECRIRVDLQKK
ncbi:MAG: hypothetical protein JW874_09510 [Spirochaetales bacterium]|nr:hypothetical protein [Spirochaetales bacterium]